MDILGTPAVALLIGLIIAAVGYHNIFPEDKAAWSFDGVLAEALRTAGQIVLIVGAGGAFSGVLKASPRTFSPLPSPGWPSAFWPPS